MRITSVEWNYRFNRVNIIVDDIAFMMTRWTHIRVYRSDTEGGAYTALNDGNLIPLSLSTEAYYYIDESVTASSTRWYKITLNEGGASSAFSVVLARVQDGAAHIHEERGKRPIRIWALQFCI